MPLRTPRHAQLSLLIAAASAITAFSPAAQAAPIIYDGGPTATGTQWNDATNWRGDVLPTSLDTAVFVNSSGIAPGTVIDTGADQTVLGVSIGNGNTTTGFVNNFSIANNTLTLLGRVLGVDGNDVPSTGTGTNGTDGGTVLQVKSQTLTGGVAGQTGNYTIGSNLVLNVLQGADPNIFVSSGNATLNLTGVISTSTAAGAKPSLRINGGGTVALTNPNNTFTGAVTVTNGTLIARASDLAPGSGSGVFGSQTFGLQLGRDTVTVNTQSVSLLASDGANIARGIFVNKTASTGSASIGGAPNGLTPATFSGPIYLARPVTFRSNGLTTANAVEISGLITNLPTAIASEVAVIKAQPGIVRFSNTGNNYTGTTTLTAGTLRLGASGVIPDTSGLIFNGGTLETSGFNETASTLTLLANSALDFGNAGTVSLADSSASVWTSGAILQLLQYNGTASATQFFVGSGATLSLDQLAAIDFVNPAGFDTGIYDAQQLSTGEVVPVPVPEPTTLALLALAAPALLVRRRNASR
jgi:autotransporter-associated beta strand protein